MARPALGSEARAQGLGRGLLSTLQLWKLGEPDPSGEEVKFCGPGWGLGPADPLPKPGWARWQTEPWTLGYTFQALGVHARRRRVSKASNPGPPNW